MRLAQFSARPPSRSPPVTRYVSVIVVRGAGRAFCGGYNFGGGFHQWDEHTNTDGTWDSGKDFVFATAPAVAPTQKFADTSARQPGRSSSVHLALLFFVVNGPVSRV
jgi:hypothetical protein